MSLWSNTDNLAGAPKWLTPITKVDGTDANVVVVASDTIVVANHGLATGDPVIYTSSNEIAPLVSETTYYVIAVDADSFKLATSLVNAEADTEITLTALGTSTDDTLQKMPSNLYFVDETEANVEANKAKGINTPGWWIYETYTDANSNTRHKAECLVAMSIDAATSGDANDDAVVADS